ncbi:MAG: DMT family transporter [Opitutaceae bacterium]|nr:DMT family transporter [Opitutaceae bacterium]
MLGKQKELVGGQSQDLLGGGLVFTGAAMFGFHSSVIKMAYGVGASVSQVFFYEFFLAAIILFLIGWLGGGLSFRSVFKTKGFLKVSVWGTIGGGGTALCLYLALLTLPVSLSIILLFQYLPWVFLLDFIFRRKRPSKRQWWALGLIGIGTLLAAGGSINDWSGSTVTGIFWGLLSGICYGSFLFKAREFGGIGTPVLRSFVMCVVISGLALGFLLIGGVKVWEFPVGVLGDFWLIICVLAVIGQVIPLFSYSKGIPLIGSSVSGVIASIELPVATVVSCFLLNELVVLAQWGGVALITFAVILANWPAHGIRGLRRVWSSNGKGEG